MVEPRHRRREEGGSPPLSLSLIPDRSRPPRRGPGEAYPEGPALSRQRRARAHTKTLPPHTPHRTSHTPRGRSSVCGQGALHRANLRPSLRAAGLNAGQRADDVECAAVASRGGADDQAQRTTPGKRSRASTLPLVGAPRQTRPSLPLSASHLTFTSRAAWRCCLTHVHTWTCGMN